MLIEISPQTFTLSVLNLHFNTNNRMVSRAINDKFDEW